MDRDVLKQYLEDGLSLVQIGALENRDPSTVGYWVQKHGLVANGRDKYAPRGGLTKEELEPLVGAGMPVTEMVELLGRSDSTIRHWLRKYDLVPERRRAQFSDAQIADALGSGHRTLVGICRRHGETDFTLVGSPPRPRCKRCRAEAVARRRRKVKEILVQEAGGECTLCGYRRCIAALEFHHRDPSEKRFGLAHRGVTRAIAEVRREAQKCVLLCSNCHAEVEAGFATIS